MLLADGGQKRAQGHLADHAGRCVSPQQSQSGDPTELAENLPQFGKELYRTMVDDRPPPAHVALQAGQGHGMLPQGGIRPMQQLALRELALAQQIGNHLRVAQVVFGPVDLIPFTVFPYRVGIHQAVGDLLPLQICGQKLPVVVGRFHAHHHPRGSMALYQLAQALMKATITRLVVAEAKLAQSLRATVDDHHLVLLPLQVHAST
jgi:hypothetical protein